MTSNRTIADKYNDLDSQIKALEEQKKAVKAEIVALGVELVSGEDCDVKVSLSQRSVMDFDKLLKDYGITEEQFKLFSACVKDGKSFEVLKVVAKKKGDE